MSKIDLEPTKTTKYMSLFEYNNLLSTRIIDLNHGAIPMIDEPNLSHFDMAQLEIEEGLLNYIIIRNLPDGTTEEQEARGMILPLL